MDDLNEALRQRVVDRLAAIDAALSEQVNRILHHPEFQRLEAAWRGLWCLVCDVEPDRDLKVKVLPVTRAELAADFAAAKDLSGSTLHQLVCRRPFETIGDVPFTALVLDEHFCHAHEDVSLLRSIAEVAAAACCPCLTGASPALFGLEAWRDVDRVRSPGVTASTPEHADWNALRGMPEARFLALVLPRVLARLPYGSATSPVDAFDFEEACPPGTPLPWSTGCWMNSAYVLGSVILRACAGFGWPARVRGCESGGMVQGLPIYRFVHDDDATNGPTEADVGERSEAQLARLGLTSLLSWRNSAAAMFYAIQSLHEPMKFDDANATADAQLAARLPYILCHSRFVHYLRAICRDQMGLHREPAEQERHLNEWLCCYVEPDPANAGEDAKARRPLAAARVTLAPADAGDGSTVMTASLRAHFQLEGFTGLLTFTTTLIGGAG
jgi:type VI secretion system protein ImpC